MTQEEAQNIDVDLMGPSCGFSDDQALLLLVLSSLFGVVHSQSGRVGS